MPPLSTTSIALRELVDAECFRNKSGRAEINAAADHGRIVVCRYDHHGDPRILRTHVYEAGESANAKHGEVQLVEAVGLGDIPALEQTGHHLAKRESEQRMIIGDHKPVGY